MKEPAFIEIGLKLKLFREEAGLTQKDAAELIGVNKLTISSWECGRTLPNDNHFDRICRVYRIPSSYLNFISSLAAMSKNELIKTVMEIMQESDPQGLED